MPTPEKQLFTAIGTMSGTSADGVDAALVRTDGRDEFEFVAAVTFPYDHELRDRLLIAAVEDIPAADLLKLEHDLTLHHVATCHELLAKCGLEQSELDVIGFHGHSIRHLPKQSLTWQLGNASLFAHRMGTPVVHDFRRADMACGGEGAPLVPLFHRMLLRDQVRGDGIAVLNLGGVANFTWMGSDGSIRAGDTGPGCGLLDAWVKRNTGKAFDTNGELAARGSAVANIVSTALKDEFFSKPFPKSADRYQFSVEGLEGLSTEDGAATLCSITVRGVVAAFEQLAARPVCIYVCGGGANNPVLMQLLRETLGEVKPVSDVGLRVDSMEAECFGWLAVRRVLRLATSAKETTGCEQPVVGGSITDPSVSSRDLRCD